MPKNRLQQLHEVGQSIWLDYIDRPMLMNGDLERRIRDDALAGMTSNPTIFEKALAEGSAYDQQLASVPLDLTPWQLFELIATEDVSTACDLFWHVYDSGGGADGYVSIEVSPGVAHDAEATVTEARRLWLDVARPNLMVKVPGTDEGAVAVRRLIREGVNVNITLLFSLEAHRRVMDAYLAGLEDRLAAGERIDGIASVASFFVSRVDTEVDKRLDAKLSGGGLDARGRASLAELKGTIAVANATLAYAQFRDVFAGPRWERLAARGARLQRPLWASTSTKNPAYRDVKYVEELIGPDTVNTMPPNTIEAFRDHGVVARTVDSDVEGARRRIAQLEDAGIPLSSVTSKLLTDGIASFAHSFNSLLDGLAQKTRALAHAR